MIEPREGVWYIVVSCSKCTRTIFLFPDLNDGKGAIDANYVVTCPRCGHKDGYQATHHFHSDGEEFSKK